MSLKIMSGLCWHVDDKDFDYEDNYEVYSGKIHITMTKESFVNYLMNRKIDWIENPQDIGFITLLAKNFSCDSVEEAVPCRYRTSDLPNSYIILKVISNIFNEDIISTISSERIEEEDLDSNEPTTRSDLYDGKHHFSGLEMIKPGVYLIDITS